MNRKKGSQIEGRGRAIRAVLEIKSGKFSITSDELLNKRCHI